MVKYTFSGQCQETFPWKCKTIVFTILCLFSLHAKSQDLSHYKIDDTDGLPSNEVYQTLQDDLGFMWIACDAGLFRFDGFNFKGYSSPDQNSRSVSNLKKDLNGTIWCQNFTGQIFKVGGEELNLFYDGSGENAQYPPFTIDKQNHIWIASDESILVFTSDKKPIYKIYNHAFKSSAEGWMTIEAFKNDVIAINKKGEFFSINISNYSLNTLQRPLEIGSRHIIHTTEKELFIFSEKNPKREYYVSQFEKNEIKLIATIQPVSGAGIHYFFKSTQHFNFMGTSNGLVMASKKEEFNATYNTYLKGSKVSAIFEDKEGNFWVSTLQDGIIVIPNFSIKVYNSTNSILTDRNLYALAHEDGKLLIGTYSGELFQLHKGSKNLQLIQSNTAASYRAIRKITHYKGARIVACGPLLAPEIPSIHQLNSLNNIRDMVVLNDVLYFTTPDRTGFIRLTEKNPDISIIRPIGGKKIIADTKSNTVYIACQDGLFAYSKGETQEIKHGGKSIFTSDFAISNSTLWIGTMTNGLLQLSLTSKKFEKTIKSIKGKNIKSLHAKGSDLWIATEHGLNYYSLKSHRLTFLNKYDGLDFLEINDIELHNGKIYLATIKGLIEVPVQLKSINLIPPKIQLTNVRYANKSIQLPKKIEVDYETSINIQFIATAFRSRGDFNYQYRIINYDSIWKKQGSASPFITIASLPPGNYIFEVRAINEDGIPSINPASLEIFIHSPYYEKWWFYLLIALFGALVVTIGFLLRIKYLKKKSAAKNQLILSQLTALKAQMNPHFMYNTLSSIQDFIWQNDIKNSNYYLSRFSLLMRKILDASDSTKISLTEEIELLSLYLELEQLRFGNSFTFNFTVDTSINSDQVYIPAMIIQPFIENAVKHGLLHKKGEKILEIHFSAQNDVLQCNIKDNGIGRLKAAEIKARQEAQHRSFATKATQKRIELLNLYDDNEYKFTITDLYYQGTAIGTMVELLLPFKRL